MFHYITEVTIDSEAYNQSLNSKHIKFRNPAIALHAKWNNSLRQREIMIPRRDKKRRGGLSNIGDGFRVKGSLIAELAGIMELCGRKFRGRPQI